MQNTAKQNYPGSVAYCNTQPVNEMGLFYNSAEPTVIQVTLNLIMITSSCY